MNTTEFNIKYSEFLEVGHYGLDIDYPTVIKYLDNVFNDLIKIPGFKFSQIKLKFNSSRFYSNLNNLLPTIGFKIQINIEEEINKLVFIEEEINKRLNNI